MKYDREIEKALSRYAAIAPVAKEGMSARKHAKDGQRFGRLGQETLMALMFPCAP